MKCPKCKETKYIKSGIIKGKQRFKCKKCNYYYTVEKKSTGKSSDIKRMGLEMYLEGLGINSIARVLNVSHVAIQKWIKNYGEKLQLLKKEGELQIINIEELQKYISKSGIVEYGILLVEMKKDTSNSFWVLGKQKKVRAYGKKSRINKKTIK